jgi:hypothetical protein
MPLNRRNSQRTTARKRRAEFHRRLAEAGTFRRRLWTVAGWLMAEVTAAPETEQDELLSDLRTKAEEINGRRLK